MIPAGPVLSPQQALDHPHIRAAGFMQDVDYPGLPIAAPVVRAAVRLSETPGEIVASPHSPWQNGYVERLIGSIRRECLDHVVVFGERHLRHVLLSYMKYHNAIRTHLSLEKDAPVSRAVKLAGTILCHPVLGALHHQYVRI
jgi:hypothetical protein